MVAGTAGDKTILRGARVSVQGIESLGSHFAALCWEFDFYEISLFFKKKMEILSHL